MSSYIRRSNDVLLEMVIADMFHFEFIADQVAASARFKNMLKQAWLVAGEIKQPTRK